MKLDVVSNDRAGVVVLVLVGFAEPAAEDGRGGQWLGVGPVGEWWKARKKRVWRREVPVMLDISGSIKRGCVCGESAERVKRTTPMWP